MISLKYKMTRIGRYGNVETSTTTIPVPSEEYANRWLDSEVSQGWTMLEVVLV